MRQLTRIALLLAIAAPEASAASEDSARPYDFEPPVVKGHLSDIGVATVLRQHQPVVRQCYAEALGRRPGVSGRVVLTLPIKPDGGVGPAKISSRIPDEALTTCLTLAMRRVRFSEAEGSTKAVWTLELGPDAISPGAVLDVAGRHENGRGGVALLPDILSGLGYPNPVNRNGNYPMLKLSLEARSTGAARQCSASLQPQSPRPVAFVAVDLVAGEVVGARVLASDVRDPEVVDCLMERFVDFRVSATMDGSYTWVHTY